MCTRQKVHFKGTLFIYTHVTGQSSLTRDSLLQTVLTLLCRFTAVSFILQCAIQGFVPLQDKAFTFSLGTGQGGSDLPEILDFLALLVFPSFLFLSVLTVLSSQAEYFVNGWITWCLINYLIKLVCMETLTKHTEWWLRLRLLALWNGLWQKCSRGARPLSRYIKFALCHADFHALDWCTLQ